MRLTDEQIAELLKVSQNVGEQLLETSPFRIEVDKWTSALMELQQRRKAEVDEMVSSAALQMAPQPQPLDVWPCSREWMEGYRAWWIKRLNGTGKASSALTDGHYLYVAGVMDKCRAAEAELSTARAEIKRLREALVKIQNAGNYTSDVMALENIARKTLSDPAPVCGTRSHVEDEFGCLAHSVKDCPDCRPKEKQK